MTIVTSISNLADNTSKYQQSIGGAHIDIDKHTQTHTLPLVCTHVQTELQIINVITIITSVPKVHPTIAWLCMAETLVNHVPDETSLQTWQVTLPKPFPIQMEVTVGVPHRMAVLTKNDGPVFFFQRSHMDSLSDIGIHGTDDIGQFRPAHAFQNGTTTLIGNRPAFVELEQQFTSLAEVPAAARFIAERPHDDTGVVAVPADHTGDARCKGILPLPIMGELSHWHHTVCLNVGLITDVETVVVTHSVEGAVVRIMTNSDGVEVELSIIPAKGKGEGEDIKQCVRFQ